MRTPCRNGLHMKPRKRGPCAECQAAKDKRRQFVPGRQEAVNAAHTAWRKNNPEKNATAQKAFWNREDVKQWNRERMRLRRAGLKRDPIAAAKALAEKVAAKTIPDQYGITRKERPL